MLGPLPRAVTEKVVTTDSGVDQQVYSKQEEPCIVIIVSISETLCEDVAQIW